MKRWILAGVLFLAGCAPVGYAPLVSQQPGYQRMGWNAQVAQDMENQSIEAAQEQQIQQQLNDQVLMYQMNRGF